jgi:O-antigen/teichoic acid export membrane protein
LTVSLSPLLLASTLGRLLTIATQVVVGYFLSPDQFGEFAIVVALCNFLSLFQSGDLSRLALQDAQSQLRSAAEARSLLLAGCGFTGAAILVLAAFSHGKVNLWFAACLCLLPFLRVMANMRITLLSSHGASDKLAVVSSVDAIARSSVSIALAITGFGAWSLVIGEICAVGSSLLVAAGFCSGPGDTGPTLRPAVLRSIGLVAFSSLLNLVEREVPVFAVGLAVGASAAGSYAFAYRIATQMMIVTIPIVTLEVIPRLIAARADAEDFERTRVVERKHLVLIASSLAVLLGVCAPLAMYLLWGSRWITAAQTLPVLVMATAVRVGYLFNRGVLEARGQFRTIFMVSVLDASLIVGTTASALAFGGPLTLAFAMLGQACLILWLSRASIRRHASDRGRKVNEN